MQRHQHQRPGAAIFLLDRLEHRMAGYPRSNVQRREKFDVATHPHTPWEMGRRHDFIAQRMSVGSQQRLANQRQKV
jgi:hypothetical protein